MNPHTPTSRPHVGVHGAKGVGNAQGVGDAAHTQHHGERWATKHQPEIRPWSAWGAAAKMRPWDGGELAACIIYHIIICMSYVIMIDYMYIYICIYIYIYVWLLKSNQIRLDTFSGVV